MYVSLEEFKTWIGATGDADDHHLEPVLVAAQRYIDRYCGRSFALETGATKLYYPSSAESLGVVDLISATSVKIDSSGDRTFGTTLAPTSYELLPYSDTNGLPSTRFQEIRLWPTSSTAFQTGRLVQVVGNFGYVVDTAGVPEDIRLAALILSSRYWKRHETPLGVLGTTDLGTFERISKEDPDVAALLDQYSRTSGSGAGWVLV